MATKAERFKSEVERSGPKKKAKPVRKVTKDTPPEEKAERRTNEPTGTATRNVSKRAGKKAVVALEDSATGTPSRKSTRKSANRGKPTSNTVRKVKRAARSPQARAAKAAAKGKGSRAR